MLRIPYQFGSLKKACFVSGISKKEDTEEDEYDHEDMSDDEENQDDENYFYESGEDKARFNYDSRSSNLHIDVLIYRNMNKANLLLSTNLLFEID